MSSEQIRAHEVLDELLDCNEGLSAWEIEFIEDMDRKRHYTWSTKQIVWLDKIYERVT